MEEADLNRLNRHRIASRQVDELIGNNTLLVSRYLYQASPTKLERVLHGLIESERVTIGVQFDQQVRGSDSVPDGHTHQKAWSAGACNQVDCLVRAAQTNAN